MLIKDISDSALGGSSFPMVTYTPLQLFGDKLWLWYDFNDVSTLYSNTGATTNISNSGQIIKYVINKGKDRNYDLRSVFPNALTGTSNSVSVFQRNSLNTNKNSNFINFTGITTNAGFGPLQSISGTSTSGSGVSSLTVSMVVRLGTASNSLNNFVGGLRYNKFNVNFTRPVSDVQTTVTVFFDTNNSISLGTFIKRANERYFYLTFTIDGNRNFYSNFNNTNETSSVVTSIGTLFPIVRNVNMNPTGAGNGTGRFQLYFQDGTAQTQKGNINLEVIEYCASYEQILTPQQIINLHQYYKVKYNL